MKKRTLIILVSSVVILLIAAAVVFFIFSTEPTAESEGAIRETAMLVSVERVQAGSFTPEFIATGTIQPVEDVQLSAQVSGEVIQRAAGFVPGGIVRKGQMMIKINPADYENQLQLRESELDQAQTDLEIEMGRQNIARQDLALVGGDSLSQDQQSLVLRQPQLEAVKARIKSAEANYNQAQLNLERTTIKAPFDAQVITQNVTVGSQIAPEDNLGRLVGIDYYWVRATIPVEKIQWLSFPAASGRGSPAVIKNKSSWQESEYRTGTLFKQIGALDQQTRLARVLIRVPNPLGNQDRGGNQSKLIIGSFVEARIEGKPVNDVVKLSRDYLRSNNTAWVMEDGKLSIRELTVKVMDAEYAYITEGLEDGEEIVTTNISTVTNGVRLRTEADSTGMETDSVRQTIDSTQQNTE